MKRSPLKWILGGLVAVAVFGGVAWAGDAGIRPYFAANSTPATPACSLPEAAVSAVAARLGVDASVIAQPAELCNCNTDAECAGKCGSGGGFCGIFLACPGDPPKYVGSCFCKRTPANPVPVEP
ncbi:MAG TPA: hypothetical protein VF173_08105 [Thermoanaerobaculia bacterium]|nr:hypothetical protein [Thermoanaerobaculia bacterium]